MLTLLIITSSTEAIACMYWGSACGVGRGGGGGCAAGRARLHPRRKMGHGAEEIPALLAPAPQSTCTNLRTLNRHLTCSFELIAHHS